MHLADSAFNKRCVVFDKRVVDKQVVDKQVVDKQVVDKQVVDKQVVDKQMLARKRASENAAILIHMCRLNAFNQVSTI
jgi:hypothetical protein